MAPLIVLTLAGSTTLARPSRHDAHSARHHVGGPTRVVARGPVPAHFEAPGEIVEQATLRARAAPGMTTEFDPTAKETATGGPVGGIPSSSGGP